MSAYEKNFKIKPYNHQSEKIYEERSHALFGISPFNSYFKEGVLTQLIDWGISSFKKVHFFLPNTISMHTLMGLGYPEKRAQYKVRKEDTRLKNKLIRAIKNNQINEDENKDFIINFTKIAKNQKYLEVYRYCQNRFKLDPVFREICLVASRLVLRSYEKEKKFTKENVHMAAQYFLYEMPLFINTPYIFNVSSSLVVYHNVPGFVEFFFQNGLIEKNQGFLQVVVNNQNEQTPFVLQKA